MFFLLYSEIMPLMTRPFITAACRSEDIQVFAKRFALIFSTLDMDMTAIELLSMSCGHYFSPVFFDVQSLIIACSGLLL